MQGRSNALAERPVRATRELATRKCFQVAVIVGCGRCTYDLSQEKLMGPALLAYCSIFLFSFEFRTPFAARFVSDSLALCAAIMYRSSVGFESGEGVYPWIR